MQKFMVLRHISQFNSSLCFALLATMTLIPCATQTVAAERITEFSPVYKRILDSENDNPSETIQSMLAIDEATLDDIEKSQRAYLISDAYAFLVYPVEALKYAQQAIDLVTESEQPWLFHTYSLRKADALMMNGFITQGMGPTEDVLTWAQDNEVPSLAALAHNLKGSLLLELQDYAGALENQLRAYEIVASTPHLTHRKAIHAGAIAGVYAVRGNWEMAIPYYEEALANDRKTGDKVGASISLYGLAGAYKGLGDLEKAVTFYEESALLSKNAGDVQGEAYALKKLAIIALEHGRYSEAEGQLLKALGTFEQSKNTTMQIRSHSSLVDVYLKRTLVNRAEHHLSRAKNLLASETMKLERAKVNETEAKFLSATGEHQAAYELLAETMVRHKEVLNQKSNEQLHQIRARYESESAARENRLLDQQNRLQEAELVNSSRNITLLRLIIALSLLLCATFVYLIYRSRVQEHNLENKVKERTKELSFALDRVREYDRAKSQFLANMSHEIRTPMNGIVGMIELLQKTPLTKDQNRFVGFISNSASQLLILINDILDLSRIESGKIQLVPKRFDLHSLLEDMIQFYASAAKKKGLSLEFEDTTGLAQDVIGDEGRLRQILVNLLGNGIKFTETGGVLVNVSVAEERENALLVSFSITDSGIGIDEKSMDTIFDSFSQADNSSTRAYGGSGLGLAISRQMVELLGGEMFVDSAVDSGSTFRFTAILEKADEGYVEAEKTTAPLAPAMKVERLAGMQILMCEDNEINREVTRLHLERLGCHVEVAEDGLAGLEHFKNGNFDMILMDCQMPRMDGFEATRRIRKIEADSGNSVRIPIVAITAFAMDGDRERCLDAGMDQYLSKPFTIEKLAQALNIAI